MSTRELDYIRNAQEINLIQDSCSSCSILGSPCSNYFFRILHLYWKLLFTNTCKYDVVIVGFVPQIILPLFHNKFKNNFLIVDFFISMYDTLCFDRKVFNPTSMIGRLIKHIDMKCLSYADHILCDTTAHGDYFVSELGADKTKLETLYLQADPKIYHSSNVPRPDKLKDKFVVLYFGSILPLQGVDVILDAINQLRKNSNLYFYIIGPIDSKKRKYRKPQSDNIEYLSWVSQEELAQYIEWADLCLAGHFNADIEKAKRTIPGKAYIYHEMKKSMILGENPANHELFNDEKSIYVPMGNADALANKIKELALNLQ